MPTMPTSSRVTRIIAGAVAATALLVAPVAAQSTGPQSVSNSFPAAPTAAAPGYGSPAGTQPMVQAQPNVQGGGVAQAPVVGQPGPYAGQNGAQALAVPGESPAAVGTASQQFTAGEVVTAGHQFFGQASGSLGALIERMFSRYGLPNGYILGEEGSGAYFGGLTYGEGVLYTRNAGQHRIFWQGPSVGLDWGAQGSRTMILVYNLPELNAALGRFAGLAGEAYLVGGLGTRVLKKGGVVMVPVRTGVGARLGVNVNYLKFTAQPTWNPF